MVRASRHANGYTEHHHSKVEAHFHVWTARPLPWRFSAGLLHCHSSEHCSGGDMKLSKTDFLIFRECAHNAGVRLHRPAVYRAHRPPSSTSS